MLFDLRGRGRRRTVQGIYLGLAVLMGGGLVLFGVGGTGVGLFNNNNGDTSGGSSSNSARLSCARRAVKAHPQDPARVARPGRAAWPPNAETDQNTGRYTAKGRRSCPRRPRAWERYLALKPKQIDPTGAAAHGQRLRHRRPEPPEGPHGGAAGRGGGAPERSGPTATWPSPPTARGRPGSATSRQPEGARPAPTKSARRRIVKTQLDQAKKQGAGASAGTGATRGADERPRRRLVEPLPGPLAQLAEQGTLNPKVGGSIPPRPI